MEKIISEAYEISEDCSVNHLGQCSVDFDVFMIYKFGISFGIMFGGMLAIWLSVKFGMRLFFRGMLPFIVKCISVLNNSQKMDGNNSKNPKLSVKTVSEGD